MAKSTAKKEPVFTLTSLSQPVSKAPQPVFTSKSLSQPVSKAPQPVFTSKSLSQPVSTAPKSASKLPSITSTTKSGGGGSAASTASTSFYSPSYTLPQSFAPAKTEPKSSATTTIMTTSAPTVSAAEPIFGMTTETPKGTFSPTGEQVIDVDFTPPPQPINVPPEALSPTQPPEMMLGHRTLEAGELEKIKAEQRAEWAKAESSSIFTKIKEAPSRLMENIPTQRGKAVAYSVLGNIGTPQFLGAEIGAAFLAPQAGIAAGEFKFGIASGAVTAIPETLLLPFKFQTITEQPVESLKSMIPTTPQAMGEFVGGGLALGGVWGAGKGLLGKGVKVKTLEGFRSSDLKAEISAGMEADIMPSLTKGSSKTIATQIIGKKTIEIGEGGMQDFIIQKAGRTLGQKIRGKEPEIKVGSLGGLEGEFKPLIKEIVVSPKEASILEAMPKELKVTAAPIKTTFFGTAKETTFKNIGLGKESILTKKGGFKIEFKDYVPMMSKKDFKVTMFKSKNAPIAGVYGKHWTELDVKVPKMENIYSGGGKTATRIKPVIPTNYRISPITLGKVKPKFRFVEEFGEYISPAAGRVVGISTPSVPRMGTPKLKPSLNFSGSKQITNVFQDFRDIQKGITISTTRSREQSRLKPSFRLNEGLESKNIERSISKELNLPRLGINVDVGQTQGQRQRITPKFKFAQATRQAQKSKFKWGEEFTFPKLKTDFDFWPSGKKLGVQKKKKGWKQPTRYTPSLLGITRGDWIMKEPKILTGVEIRPRLRR